MTALLLATLLAATQPPVVRYVITTETRTWKPIELKDVERILDNSAVSPLLQRGDMQLVKSDFGSLKTGDYTLVIAGRFIEEAEDFSVYMTFGPGKREDLPSFHVAGTEAVGKRGVQEMQRIMEKLANQVANRLNILLAPELKRVDLPIQIDEKNETTIPQLWQWPKLTEPDVPKPSVLLKTLLDPRHEDHERARAVTDIGPAAFDELPARKALERCILRDPDPHIRIACAQALEPVARVNASTQRVFMHAMRNEYEGSVLRVFAHISSSFNGLSHTEAVDTWLYLVQSSATPEEAMDDITSLLRSEGARTPNLDVAIASCLRQSNAKFGKKSECARTLLPVVPDERKRAIIMDYIERIDPVELASYAATHEIMEDVPRMKDLDREDCDLIVSTALRAPGRYAKSQLSYAFREKCDNPTKAQIDSFLGAITMKTYAQDYVRAISEVELSNEMKEYVTSGLQKAKVRLEKTGCVATPFEGSVLGTIDEAVKRLSYRRQ
jgi:hypothetical protein